MDDMMESQAELEYEVTKIFEDLEEGTMLTTSQIDTLRYVCGFPKKRRVNPVLSAIADDFSNIFWGEEMIVTGSTTQKKEFKIAPVGSHLARLYRIIDLGTQTSEYMGQTKMLRKVKFFWELHGDDLNTDDGKPLIQTRNYTLSLGEKASLRKDLESWRGKSFTDDELRGFDISNLLDKWCMVTVQHRTANNGNTYADAVAVTPVPAIVAKAGLPKGENPCLIFDLQKFDQAIFDGLSQGLKDQIMQSAEMRNKKDVNKLLQDAKIEDDEDLSVPF